MGKIKEKSKKQWKKSSWRGHGAGRFSIPQMEELRVKIAQSQATDDYDDDEELK